MDDLLNESLLLDASLEGLQDESAEEKKIRVFLGEQKGLELPQNFLSSSELEWFNKPSEPLNGKIIVLDFFTYCCINCVQALPILEALEAKYTREQVLLIGIHSAKFTNEKSSKNIQHALSRHGIHRPVINDHSLDIWNTFEVTCWPSILIIDQSFRLRKYFVGEGFLSGVDRFIGFLLNAPLIPLSSPSLLKTSEGSKKSLHYPGKISIHEESQRIAISDSGNHRVIILFSNDKSPLIIGTGSKGYSDGPLEQSSFSSPQGVLLINENTLYVADTGNHTIRKVCLAQRRVSTILGNGEKGSDYVGGGGGRDQSIASPWDLCLGPDSNGSGEVLYIAMAGLHQIWAYGLTETDWWKGVHRTQGIGFALAGNGREENRNNSYPHQASFAQPSGICYVKEELALFIADSESSSIRRLNLKDGSVRNVCGGERDPTNLFAFGDLDDKGVKAKLQHPLSVRPYTEGRLLVCDTYNNKLKIIQGLNEKAPCLSTFEPSLFPNLEEPSDLIYSIKENSLYVVDSNNHQILTYCPSSKATSVLRLPPLSPKKQSRSSEDLSLQLSFSSSSFEIHFLSKSRDKRIVDGELTHSTISSSSCSLVNEGRYVVRCHCRSPKGKLGTQIQVMLCSAEESSCRMMNLKYLMEFSVTTSNEEGAPEVKEVYI
eukprot:TRINITY_DN4113_c0_g1_i1.p1 TRINITY_DN4113_c0_g1~~TRINITY_DN4113_c0_g1_i1.p1  ORF type:complete len:658 (-),score=157.15 TRINITY_DN4113_c0_g1_i1:77-2050(-)